MKRLALPALGLVGAVVAAGCAGGHASPIDQTKVTTSSAVLEGTWSSNKGKDAQGHNTPVTVWFEIGTVQSQAYGTSVAVPTPVQPNCTGLLTLIPNTTNHYGSYCSSDAASASHTFVANTATAWASTFDTHLTLTPNTPYHYRLCAFEPGGQSVPICIGEQTFTTNGNS